MDIQRKCFEESNNVNPDWSFKFDEELQQYIALDSEMELQVDEFNELWDTFRAGWQAAKTQADKKIKLLLCDEHLKKCESPTGVFNSQYPDEEPCLICLAKQYKAQAVPDTYTPIVLALESVQSKIAKTSFLTMDEENENEVMAVNANELAAYIDELIEAQEPTND